jgi:16S rRNA (cytosine967-C5)-methyltransferase
MPKRRTGEPVKRQAKAVSPSRRRGADNARAIALEILRRVEATDAYANLLVDARLQRSRLSGPDRALVTELVYGVLRWRGKLDWVLAPVLDRPVDALDSPVRQVLHLGAYQLCCLTRIPDYAAVDETVALARRTGGARHASYVNAVLRAVARSRDRPEPEPASDPVGYWKTVGSHPGWLVERWIRRLGTDEAAGLMAANNAVPPVTVLANPLRARDQEVRQALERVGVEVGAGRWVPGAFCLRGAGSVGNLPGFADGWLIPMDEAGVFPVLALDVQPGDRVLDACAGGGGKSALIAARIGSRGEVIALDNSARALRRLEAARARLGLARVTPRLGDARSVGQESPGHYSRILLDAPCTGLGTIRRRPEIKWRRRPEDLQRAAVLQRELLAGVADAVAPGGLLVYSTCSLEPEETGAVMADFLAAHPSFQVEDPGADFRGLDHLVDGDGYLRSWPHRDGTDGFFVARLRRRH